jgi:hypothetical protein
MPSPTTPKHGKYGAVYIAYDNGYKPGGVGASVYQGKNDATWGENVDGIPNTTSVFEVQIMTNGTPDTFKWQKNFSGWSPSTPVSTDPTLLSDLMTIKWDSTIDHAVGDRWLIGTHHAVTCTISGKSKQITDPEWRICNIGHDYNYITRSNLFLDTTAGYPKYINWNTGAAYYTINPTLATTNELRAGSYVNKVAMVKVAYVSDWSFSTSLDMADSSYMGEHWKSSTPGQGGTSGSLSCFFISASPLLGLIKKDEERLYKTQKFYHLSLYTYDPNLDGSGDYFSTWATITSNGISTSVGDVVKESIDFTGEGIPAFVPSTV